jgi:hypothetical protein
VSASSATAASSVEAGSWANVCSAQAFWARICCSSRSSILPANGASGRRVIGPLDLADNSARSVTCRSVKPSNPSDWANLNTVGGLTSARSASLAALASPALG